MTTTPHDHAPKGPPPRSDEEMLRIARTALIAQGLGMDNGTAIRILPDVRRLVDFAADLIASPEEFAVSNGSPTDILLHDRTITVVDGIRIVRIRDGEMLTSRTSDFGQMHLTPGSKEREVAGADVLRFWGTETDTDESRSTVGGRAVPGRSAVDLNAIDAHALVRDATIGMIALERVVAASTFDSTRGDDDPYVLDWKAVETVTTVVEHDVMGDHPIGPRDTIDFASPWRPAMIDTGQMRNPKDPRMARSWMLRDQVPLIRIDMLNDTMTISSLKRNLVPASIDPVTRFRMHAEAETMRLGPIGRRYAQRDGDAS